MNTDISPQQRVTTMNEEEDFTGYRLWELTASVLNKEPDRLTSTEARVKLLECLANEFVPIFWGLEKANCQATIWLLEDKLRGTEIMPYSPQHIEKRISALETKLNNLGNIEIPYTQPMLDTLFGYSFSDVHKARRHYEKIKTMVDNALAWYKRVQTIEESTSPPSTPEQTSIQKITLAEGTTAADIERIFTAMQQAGIITTEIAGERIAQMFFAPDLKSLKGSYDKAKSIRNGEGKGSKNSERLREFAQIILRDLKPK